MFKLKRTFVLCLFAALTPVAAFAQVEAPPTEVAPPKYQVYVGAAYSRIRQVDETFSGLVGGKATVTRDFGKYFQLMGSGDYYKLGTGHSFLGNIRGNPSIYTFMVGPQLHAPLFGKVSGLVFAEVGGEHTGGETLTPSISFAGGFGGGLTYDLSKRFGLQLTGDRVGASFSLPNNNPQLAYSTHRTWNARVTMGAYFRF